MTQPRSSNASLTIERQNLSQICYKIRQTFHQLIIDFHDVCVIILQVSDTGWNAHCISGSLAYLAMRSSSASTLIQPGCSTTSHAYVFCTVMMVRTFASSLYERRGQQNCVCTVFGYPHHNYQWYWRRWLACVQTVHQQWSANMLIFNWNRNILTCLLPSL